MTGLLAAALISNRTVQRHFRGQNHILDHCRSLFVLATQAVERSSKSEVEMLLKKIRNPEMSSKIGQGWPFRIALFAEAIFYGVFSGLAWFFVVALVHQVASKDISDADRFVFELRNNFCLRRNLIHLGTPLLSFCCLGWGD